MIYKYTCIFTFFSLRICLIFILLLPAFKLSAQKKFQQGYIITNNNDTLYGAVKDRKEAPFAKIYKKVRFRDGSFSTKRFSNGEIAGYKAGERTYESLWLSIKTDFLRTSYRNIPGAGEKKFIRVVFQNYLSYYELELIDQESGIVETIPLFRRRTEDQFIRVTQGLFGLRKNSLSEYFGDCPELIEKMESDELKIPFEIAVFYNHNCGIK